MITITILTILQNVIYIQIEQVPGVDVVLDLTATGPWC